MSSEMPKCAMLTTTAENGTVAFGIRQTQHLHGDLVELLTCTESDDLCLVHLQSITGHPVSDVGDAPCQSIHCIGAVMQLLCC